MVDVLGSIGKGTWDWAIDTVSGVTELAKILGESAVSLPNTLPTLISQISHEIDAAQSAPDHKLQEVAQKLGELYTKLGHYADTDKLANALSDWIENIYVKINKSDQLLVFQW